MSSPGHFPARAVFFGSSQTIRLACAFTLVELLVVIAIIAILAGLLLPTLTRAKASALSAACLNNLKQLETAWHLYTHDNNDDLPPNNFVYDVINDQPITSDPSWCTNLAPWDTNFAGIENGMLFPYNTSDAIYHCPADTSLVETKAGVSLGVPRLRTYNMSQSVNGVFDPNSIIYTELPCFVKYTEIMNPGPSSCFVFIDVHEDEIIDTQFGIPVTADAWYGPVWYDVPANRHNQGCNFSFADGHAEHWRWVFPKSVTVPRGNVQPVNPAEMNDYNRMETGFRQTLN